MCFSVRSLVLLVPSGGQEPSALSVDVMAAVSSLGPGGERSSSAESARETRQRAGVAQRLGWAARAGHARTSQSSSRWDGQGCLVSPRRLVSSLGSGVAWLLGVRLSCTGPT